MVEVEATVHRVLRRVLQLRTPPLPPLTHELGLTTELGLKSLDLARLVAVLELELGVDPFAQLVAITDLRTLGDLCDAYRRALNGQVADAPSFRPSHERAANRRASRAKPHAEGREQP